MFKKNLDTGGRVFRALIATALLFLAFCTQSWIALLASLFVYFEAIRGWCPFMQLLGKDSCPKK